MRAFQLTGGWLVFLVILAAAPLVFDSRLGISILNELGITLIFALSYNMLLGQAGMLSFGHAVYFGLGGFMAVHMLNYVEEGFIALPTPLVPLIGGFTGLLFGIIIGSFSTRRSGTVFAMISLGVGEMVAAASLIFVGFFGGESGVSGDRTYGPAVFGHQFFQDIEVYVVIAVWLFIATLLMYLYSRTPVGRMANAVRDNPERVEFVGYSQRWVRFMSFCAAGFFAGIAGGLFAINYEILTEENVGLYASGNVLLMAYIGGTGFFIGPMIGAVVLTLLRSVLGGYTELWQLYLGVLFVFVVMYLPTGLSGFLMQHRKALHLGRLHTLLVPYLAIGVPAFILTLAIAGLLEMVSHQRESLTGEHTMNLYFISVSTDSAGSWVTMIVLAIGAGFCVKWLKPWVMRAWEEANTPPVVAPAEEDANS